MTKSFEYKSTGLKHEEENQFFQFLVKSRFYEENNRSFQWCRFEGLKVIVETLEPSIVDFVKLTLKNTIETSSGHRYELK
jgi:hypothetical protein